MSPTYTWKNKEYIVKNKSRIKRKVVKWQTKDQGANPLTKRGRKWIKREIKNINVIKLRKQLDNQVFDESCSDNAYWNWVEQHNSIEMHQANPDLITDDLDNTVD